MKKLTFNPTNGRFEWIFNVPEVTADPASPADGDMWMLYTPEIKAGEALGLFGYTKAEDVAAVYELKYQSSTGTKKVTLS